MKLRLPSRKRALRWAIYLVIFAVIAIYLLLPIGIGIAVVFPYKESVGDPPEGFEEVRLDARDGVTLAGWYAPPENGAVIIVLAGAGGTREDTRGHAAMLVSHGYGVLAVDLRGSGESEGTTNRFGWQGTRDVQAAADWLADRPEVERIGGLGISLGAEVLLGAASDVPALLAIVADGATSRSIGEVRALESERPLVRNFVQRVLFATVQVLTGDDPPHPLLDAMVEAESAAFLLIAAGKDSMEVKYNELFAETVGGRSELWVVPGASHTAGFRRAREEYEQRVIAFFDGALPDR